MKVIGIVGGIACGKSLVAGQLKELGAEVLDADRVGHEALCQPEIIQAIVQRWGPTVLRDDGTVDRGAIARIVFAPPPEGPIQLAYLEELTHPEIERRIKNRLAELAASRQTKVTVIDAALLFEARWDQLCDRIIFIDTPREQRIARALGRGWSEAEFASREAAQDSLDSKRERADFIVDNSSTIEHTLAQVHRFWQSLNVDATGS